MPNLDRPVSDHLLLRTVPGAVDYLFEELRTLPEATVTARRRDGVVVDLDGPLSALTPNRYFTSAAVVLGDDPAAGLTASAKGGALSAAVDAAAPIRFRVGAIGEQRWRLRDALVSLGWVNDPGDWDVNVAPDGDAAVAEIGSLYWTKRFGELLRAPASTNPVIASVMTRLAKIEPDHTVLDPVCGAGTLLVAAGETFSPARLLGGDHDRRWAAAARDNLADRRVPAGLWRGDARAVPLADDSVDRVVANLPFGKRVGSHVGNKQLYPKLLREIARLLKRTGRAVLLTEDKRLFVETVQRTRGLRIVKEVVFATGGAHPSAYVVTTRRTR
ncbi:MAG: TRM11 family SAM-dependent methyltransferase [Stackebrandtia sp.]